MEQMKRVLVTGGAGFVGSRLCDELIDRGHYVICLDNFVTGSIENIQHLRRHERFELVRHDIVEPILLEVDWIFNLACPASPVHYQHNPIKTIKTSVIGALNMLGLARRVEARILQASTSEVYGDPQVHPQTEDYWGHVNPTGIRSCYDEGKRCAEALFMDYRRTHELDVRIVRIFNTYGPRMSRDDGRVVSNFIAQTLSGKPLTIYGAGSQTRSFCYVDDLVEGLLRLMEYEGPQCHEPHNLGNPNESTMLELAELVTQISGQPMSLVHKPLPADDPKRRLPDISRAKKHLGWQPRVPLAEGLAKTIDDFRRRYDDLAKVASTTDDSCNDAQATELSKPYA